MVLFDNFQQHHYFMNEFKNKLGKFLIIIGGLFILLFTFSIIADSVDFYLFITGMGIILFGTILRRKPKKKEEDNLNSNSFRKRQGRNSNLDNQNRDHPESRQSRRSKRS